MVVGGLAGPQMFMFAQGFCVQPSNDLHVLSAKDSRDKSGLCSQSDQSVAFMQNLLHIS